MLPRQLTFIPIYDYDNKSFYNNDENDKKGYTGKRRLNNNISKNSERKLKYAINTLKSISSPKQAFNFKSGKHFNFLLNFITLTLPSKQGNLKDCYIKRNLLNNFISSCKTKYGLKDYVWKAERQKNDNLHFHITTNTYMNYEWIRNKWNKILLDTEMMKNFYNKFKHNNPNSTDIHSVKNIHRIDLYLIKYFSKSGNDEKLIEGKLWDCSKSLNFNNRLHFQIDDKLRDGYEWIIKKYESKLYVTGYFTSLIFNNDSEFNKLPREYIEIYRSHLEKLKNLT
jgi:hypothetical protein